LINCHSAFIRGKDQFELSLKGLGLYSCHFSDIVDFFTLNKMEKSIKTLFLMSNYFKRIPIELKVLTNLKLVDLHHNRLNKFDPEIFAALPACIFIVSRNELFQVPMDDDPKVKKFISRRLKGYGKIDKFD